MGKILESYLTRNKKALSGIFSVVILTIFLAPKSYSQDWSNDARKAQTSLVDQMKYLCIKLDELYSELDPDELKEELEEKEEKDIKQKAECDNILKSVDSFEKKAILKKYE